jgi:hypothetical protein
MENNEIDREIQNLIDAYSVRAAKIEQAVNRASGPLEKTWKESAAKQTRRFLTDLRRLKKRVS